MICMSKRFLFAVLLFLTQGYSQDSLGVLGLKQAVELGLKNNFQIKLARLDEQQADTDELLKIGTLLPKVSLQGGGTFDLPSSKQALGVQVTGQWTLFDGFQMFYVYRSIGKRQEITGVQKRREIETQSLDIVRRYLNAVVQKDLLQNSVEQKNYSQVRLQEVKNAYELGSRTRLEWVQAKLSYQQDSANWHRQQLRYLESCSDLSLLLGLEPSTKYRLYWDGSLPNFKQVHRTWEEWWKEVERKNADLTFSQQQTQLLYTERSIQRSAFWPKFILSGSYGVTGDFVRQGQIGLHVEYPLFQGFTQRVSTARANTALQKQKISYTQLKLHLKHLLHRQWNTVEQALQQTQVEKLGVALAAERLELAKDSYKRGQISGLELRNAQLDWQKAVVHHLSVLVQARLSILELERMAGRIQL